MERIKIKNFIVLEDIHIELKRLNIFIGKQGTGKSLLSKLIYFFKSIPIEMLNAVDQKAEFKKFVEMQEEKFISYFYLESYFKEEFLIEYEFDNKKIIVNNKEKFEIIFSEYYENLYNEIRNKYLELEALEFKNTEGFILDAAPIVKTFSYIIDKLKKEGNDLFLHEQLFIPSGRSFYSILAKNIFSILENINNINDPFIIRFGRLYEQLKKKEFFKDVNKNENSIFNIKINQILNGNFIKEKNEDFIKLNNGKLVKLSQASSGQQEILPLILALKNIVYKKDKVGKTLYIEEPETHLFPETQKKIVELISLVFNIKKDIQFFITTHSPYILVALNNLMIAEHLYSNISDENKKRKINEIVNSDFHISLKDVSAYLFENGKIENIKDNFIISADIIDEISDVLAKQFDSLMEWIDEID
ncbi:Predicted ATPase [Marinitoga hydrogenitolerans DSM 16785]|uniref:Predicted ATPase n=1 Tax=Marinitoga hydrogenitolerans (strain DSM 16785 / JCM 12826 / AT1271) TaxID=1122195 RepID=A0A1M4YVH5_MARH1|nr:ATP-binding protein [Marinitoga hydrogenitolerans]SHF09783.1 Predicted ATPase [Marinitoga hydrogenitolerans DSM 16785]